MLIFLSFQGTVSNDKIQGTFLKKDDPRILALMQQAELLSSLAVKVNMENTDQSLENAWKVRNSRGRVSCHFVVLFVGSSIARKLLEFLGTLDRYSLSV